jgi:hypothetical protein
MTATISEVKQGLANRLATIPGLRSFAYQPDQLNPPIAYAMLDNITYNRAMQLGAVEYQFTVTVVVARATERPAEAAIDGYTSPTGTSSVRAAIEGDRTLGGKVSTLIVETATGIQTLSANDADYLSVDFTVRVYS